MLDDLLRLGRQDGLQFVHLSLVENLDERLSIHFMIISFLNHDPSTEEPFRISAKPTGLLEMIRPIGEHIGQTLHVGDC